MRTRRERAQLVHDGLERLRRAPVRVGGEHEFPARDERLRARRADVLVGRALLRNHRHARHRRELIENAALRAVGLGEHRARAAPLEEFRGHPREGRERLADAQDVGEVQPPLGIDLGDDADRVVGIIALLRLAPVPPVDRGDGARRLRRRASVVLHPLGAEDQQIGGQRHEFVRARVRHRAEFAAARIQHFGREDLGPRAGEAVAWPAQERPVLGVAAPPVGGQVIGMEGGRGAPYAVVHLGGGVEHRKPDVRDGFLDLPAQRGLQDAVPQVAEVVEPNDVGAATCAPEDAAGVDRGIAARADALGGHAPRLDLVLARLESDARKAKTERGTSDDLADELAGEDRVLVRLCDDLDARRWAHPEPPGREVREGRGLCVSARNLGVPRQAGQGVVDHLALERGDGPSEAERDEIDGVRAGALRSRLRDLQPRGFRFGLRGFALGCSGAGGHGGADAGRIDAATAAS